MSARWRRSKRKIEQLDVFKVLRKGKSKRHPKVYRSTWVKPKKTFLNRQVSQVGYDGRKMKRINPLVDVIEHDDEIIVVAQLVGFDKERLQLKVENHRLSLSAEELNQRYHKSLNLPKRVNPNTMKSTYKNGVLEIRLKKADKDKSKDQGSWLKNATQTQKD